MLWLSRQQFIAICIVFCSSCWHLKAQSSTTVRPYKFGFTIDQQQHRYESRDERGIVMGEFGFITADGIYHVTVYATDEEGRFRILAMKSYPYESPPKMIEMVVRAKSSSKNSDSQNSITTMRTLQQSSTAVRPAAEVRSDVQGCSGCFIPTKPPVKTSQKPPAPAALSRNIIPPVKDTNPSKYPSKPSATINRLNEPFAGNSNTKSSFNLENTIPTTTTTTTTIANATAKTTTTTTTTTASIQITNAFVNDFPQNSETHQSKTFSMDNTTLTNTNTNTTTHNNSNINGGFANAAVTPTLAPVPSVSSAEHYLPPLQPSGKTTESTSQQMAANNQFPLNRFNDTIAQANSSFADVSHHSIGNSIDNSGAVHDVHTAQQSDAKITPANTYKQQQQHSEDNDGMAAKPTIHKPNHNNSNRTKEFLSANEQMGTTMSSLQLHSTTNATPTKITLPAAASHLQTLTTMQPLRLLHHDRFNDDDDDDSANSRLFNDSLKHTFNSLETSTQIPYKQQQQQQQQQQHSNKAGSGPAQSQQSSLINDSVAGLPQKSSIEHDLHRNSVSEFRKDNASKALQSTQSQSTTTTPPPQSHINLEHNYLPTQTQSTAIDQRLGLPGITSSPSAARPPTGQVTGLQPGSRPGSPAGFGQSSPAGSRTGSPAGSLPGSSAGFGQSSPAGSLPGLPAGSRTGSPAGFGQSSPAGSRPGSQAGFQPGSPAGFGQSSPAGSRPGSQASFRPGSPAGLGLGSPTGSRPGLPTGFGQGSPAGFRPGSPAGFGQSSPTGSRPGSSAGLLPGSAAGSRASSLDPYRSDLMDIIIGKVLPALGAKTGLPQTTTTAKHSVFGGPAAVSKGFTNPMAKTTIGKFAARPPGSLPNPSSSTYNANAKGNSLNGELYRFKYILDYHGHSEMGWRNGNKQGNYFNIGDDDIQRTIDYVANENGYQPSIRWRKLTTNEIQTKALSNALKEYEFIWFH